MNIYEVFLEMRHMQKGHWIENPYDLIQTDFILSNNILHILQASRTSVFFTRLSIKHLSEKGNSGEYILYKMKEILETPDNIYLGNFKNRFLISKMIMFQSDIKPHVITLEITKNTENIIVTGFIARNSYFKNLELLWGAAQSPSQQP